MSGGRKTIVDKLKEKDFRILILLYVMAIIFGVNMIIETIQAYKNI